MTRAGELALTKLLDDPDNFPAKDPGGMLSRLASFPAELEAALECGRGPAIALGHNIESVLFCGMGGSAIGAELLRSWLGARLGKPLIVNRSSVVPAFVGPSTLAVVCSYSGNTRETLEALEQVRAAGAVVACISSNGELERRARTADLPLVTIPSGSPPRAAVAFTTVPAVQLLHRAGLAPDCESEVRQSVRWLRTQLREYAPDRPRDSNPAKRLACALRDKAVVVYGSQDRLDAVARRWAGQFSENAKQLTFFGAIPEMTHNEIVGWMSPLSTADWAAVFLHDDDDPLSVRQQAFLTRQLLEERLDCILVGSASEAPWPCRLWDMVLLGDYASVYLAFLNREDPTPVRAIDQLKARMEALEGDSLSGYPRTGAERRA